MHRRYLDPPVTPLKSFPNQPTVIAWYDNEFVAVLNISVGKGYLGGLLGSGSWLCLQTLPLLLPRSYQLLSLRAGLEVASTCGLGCNRITQVDLEHVLVVI
jgi:hypothetical protein